MNAERFATITGQYPKLRIAVVGDFCLDRYLEIDPAKAETSIETGLPVYNVVNVRAQPGGAGTVLNNLVALGVGEIFPVGFIGDDGEGYELRRALAALPGVRLDYLLQTSARRTFTYCKPLIVQANQPPRELNRLDQKNWTPTPSEVVTQLSAHLQRVADRVDGMVVLGQEDDQATGVVTPALLETLGKVVKAKPQQMILADSRRSLRNFPRSIFKMNAAELSALTGMATNISLKAIGAAAVRLAQQNQRPVFVTLSERGILGATPDGQIEHLPALPLRGEIDIVGAGDSVSANLLAALLSGATLREALTLANAASSIVIHQLGTTGTANVAQLQDLVLAESAKATD
ncbi:MAG TPA: PfkB family carbohydrate kinase [Verrucomicrobiota bacterium]|jgi:rfaE bifunctional protein kinase chain/domain|nr:MAG: Bifunctional protein HldE [Verrucomicrobia bacterium ADurb.Bin118]HPY29330.1 PfkB family carbohydrate kinase [Verrucomicrobiota bacterium]HQB15913.1 PfkB family carbohydrate kinase [Verrucomicrobiota bacterium]